MEQLVGRVAVVTGAAQGIGWATAERLVAEGCKVVITDRQESVIEIASAMGATGHVGDVADAHHVRSVVDATVAAYGTVDIMVSNAGEVRQSGPRDEWDHAAVAFDQVIGSNTKGAFLFGRAVAPIMIKGGGGDIVNISTDHVKPGPGCHPHHGHGAMDLYNASKWALNGLTFDWARSLSRHHIRVNNICMGATDTAMLRGWLGDNLPAEVMATWMQPAQIAQVLVELIEEGPQGRTGNSIGLYAGEECVLPPSEAL
ncbi:MAG: NAD(P)-dependent dehydrogenase (short-subunit alcohol dehydrogenase family) [Ilumatobacter sp.]|jgi:NAD(P)-dependent dehydrogenase (short-subunit alcohol dehydrogenase family)